MALDQIPPWLDVHPRDFVAAMESGARAGEAAASLDQRAGESAADNALKARQLSQQQADREAQQGIEQQKLDAGLQESAADRALKEKLSGQEMALNAAKFGVGTGLDVANLNLRKLAEDRQESRLKLAENTAQQKAQLNADKAVRQASFISKLNDADSVEKLNKFASENAEALADPNSSAMKVWQGKYNHLWQKENPKTGAAGSGKEVLQISPRTGAVLSKTVTRPLGSREETDHVAKPSGPVKVNSQAEYDKLPPGTKGISPSGKPFTKPGNPQSPLSQAQQDDVIGLPAAQ
jgi:hypothetical protein